MQLLYNGLPDIWLALSFSLHPEPESKVVSDELDADVPFHKAKALMHVNRY